MTTTNDTAKSDRIKAAIRAEMLVDYKGRPFTGEALKFYNGVLDFMLDGMVITIDTVNERITMMVPGAKDRLIVMRSDRHDNQFMAAWWSDRPEVAKTRSWRGCPTHTAREAFMNYFGDAMIGYAAEQAEAMAG
jgi:hypothetical protein